MILAVPGKTIAEKLVIKPGAAVWFSDTARAELLGPLPAGVTQVGDLSQASAATLFAEDAGSLRRLLEANEDALKKPAVFWIAYRKGNVGDLNRDSLWPLLIDYGMRPVTQVAIDDTWSALRFRGLKPGEKWPPA